MFKKFGKKKKADAQKDAAADNALVNEGDPFQPVLPVSYPSVQLSFAQNGEPFVLAKAEKYDKKDLVAVVR